MLSDSACVVSTRKRACSACQSSCYAIDCIEKIFALRTCRWPFGFPGNCSGCVSHNQIYVLRLRIVHQLLPLNLRFHRKERSVMSHRQAVLFLFHVRPSASRRKASLASLLIRSIQAAYPSSSVVRIDGSIPSNPPCFCTKTRPTEGEACQFRSLGTQPPCRPEFSFGCAVVVPP